MPGARTPGTYTSLHLDYQIVMVMDEFLTIHVIIPMTIWVFNLRSGASIVCHNYNHLKLVMHLMLLLTILLTIVCLVNSLVNSRLYFRLIYSSAISPMNDVLRRGLGLQGQVLC